MADLLDKLTDTIRSGSIGTATKRSAKWFQNKIKGLKSDQIENILGYSSKSEIIHRDDMVKL